MPKIPTYTSQLRPTAEAPGVKSSVQQPLQTALTDVGSAISKYYIAQKTEEAKLKSQEYENQSWNELYGMMNKHSKNPYPSSASQNFLNEANEYKQNFLNTTLAKENKFTRDAFSQRFDANIRSGLLAVEKGSYKLFTKKKEDGHKEFASGISTRIRLDKSFWDKSSIEIDDYASKIEDENERNLVKDFLIDSRDATILDYKATKEPNQLLAELTKNPDLYNNIPELKQKAIAKAQSINEKNFDNNIDSLSKKLVDGFSFGNTAKGLQLTKSGFEKQEWFKNLPEDKKNKVKSAVSKIFLARDKTIEEKGSAEYFINTNAELSNAYTATLIEGDAVQRQELFSEYAKELNQKMDRINVPKNFRTFLPASEINNIKQVFDGIQDPDKAIQEIERMKIVYGDYLPQVAKQINKDIGSDLALAISVNDRDIKYSAVQGKLTDDEKRQVRAISKDKSVESTIEFAIADKFSPLGDILLEQPKGSSAYGDLVNSTHTGLTNAAMRLILDNKETDPDRAAEKIMSKFLSDYNTTNDTFYIPFDVNGKTVNQALIEAKAEVFKTKLYYNELKFEDFDVDLIGEGGKAKTKEETIDYFKQNGEWYMDGNTGIKYGVKEPSGGFTPMNIIVDNKSIPLAINFLEFDGTFKNIKDKNGFPLVIDMDDIYSFMLMEDPSISTMMP